MPLGDFTNQAEAYGKSRPGYPIELIDHLISDAGLSNRQINQHPEIVSSINKPSSRQDDDAVPVADLGAGTGIMTRMLVDKGFRVSAIEPNESMRKLATVLGAQWLPGTFEESGLDTASQQWAVAAQAFHWADPPRCLPEIRRILRPGCLFTVLWNNRSPIEGDVVDWTQKAIKGHVPEFDEAYRDLPIGKILESTGDFKLVGRRSAIHTILMSKQRYLDLWKSHNRLNSIAGPDRFATFFGDLCTYLERQPDAPINVRYDCDAWSARRNN